MCALITDVTGKVKYIQNRGGFPPKIFCPPPCSATCTSILPWSLTFVETHFIVVFPTPFPISTDLLKGVLGASFLPCTWGLMAGLPGFANHGNSLLLGAGCQQ